MKKNMGTIDRGVRVAIAVVIAILYFTGVISGTGALILGILAVIFGLVAGLLIGLITEFYTGTGTRPVKGIVNQSLTGSATNINAGLGVGMQSTAIPIVILAADGGPLGILTDADLRVVVK